jgi:hypothetical protein
MSLSTDSLNGLTKADLSAANIRVSDYGYCWVLNYLPWAEKFADITRLCRALVWDPREQHPLARGFDRFFNWGEDPECYSRDFSEATVYEKVDGSLILVWWNPYTGHWQASTRSVHDASGATPMDRTFMDVIHEAIGCSLDELMAGRNTTFTWIFELVSPETRIVTEYSEPALYLLCVRNTQTGEEFCDLESLAALLPADIRVPKTYKVGSKEDIDQMLADLPEREEGYVCRWSDGYRLKIKNPAYLALWHTWGNGNLSPKRIMRLIQSGEVDEFLSYFPDTRAWIEPYRVVLEEIRIESLLLSEDLVDLVDRKDLAATLKGNCLSALVFAYRDGRTFDEFVSKATVPYLLRLVKRYRDVLKPYSKVHRSR